MAAREWPFWMSPLSYWQPAHFPDTAWGGHAPFAFWLMDVLAPRSVVELGTHNGFSTFVFAEAAKRLGLDTTIDAVDSWEGDEHIGFYGDEVYRAVAEIAAADYPDTVRLRRGYFADVRPQVPDASTDLLHIDGRHFYEDVLEDVTMWRSSVRDGGVILFHDIAVTERGFGVWRVWDELSQQHPTFSFRHSYGLGVLAVGEVADPRLRALFDADDATADRIRADYERLGAAVTERVLLDAVPGQLAALVDSESWRLTRPLRVVWQSLKRSRGRGQPR
ncbi:hypothetical protein GCM10022200_13800 [Microbacterium awajiense]|uniref:Methyltransferase domain-containing protein n=1 Tax=Microbacterium awajiense TaxID=415214 RepID=A0ABP7AHC8_9MICO